nr:hypothetical protein [Candidatus Freyrarchaeum guaymaensis]
ALRRVNLRVPGVKAPLEDTIQGLNGLNGRPKVRVAMRSWWKPPESGGLTFWAGASGDLSSLHSPLRLPSGKMLGVYLFEIHIITSEEWESWL